METNIDQAASVIVKSDHTGHTRYTFEYKHEVLAAFETSSLSAPDFARQCGIKYPTFAAWIAERKRDDRQGSRGNTPAFLVAEVSHPPPTDPHWKSGCRSGPSSAHRTQLIRLLAVLLRQLA